MIGSAQKPPHPAPRSSHDLHDLVPLPSRTGRRSGGVGGRRRGQAPGHEAKRTCRAGTHVEESVLNLVEGPACASPARDQASRRPPRLSKGRASRRLAREKPARDHIAPSRRTACASEIVARQGRNPRRRGPMERSGAERGPAMPGTPLLRLPSQAVRQLPTPD